MELVADKKEQETNNSGNNTTNIQPLPGASDREIEDRERIALDLKAGLHPLKVRILFLYFFLCVDVCK